jgi:calcium/calmodulin-dependent protein kinase I
LKREIAVMKKLDHSSVVKFFGAFEDEEFYYLVLEYLSGGELFDRISAQVFYNENSARVILISILEAVKYCHDKDIVHRDLKPENLLLCSLNDDAKLKLADFGFAVEAKGLTITDCCGSPEYMAPEVLTSEPYGKPADMWSLGIILYILLGGYPPFYDTNQQKMFKQIIAGKFEFHDEYWSSVTPEAKDLINKLLEHDHLSRITIDEVYKHPWIQLDTAQLAAIDLATSLKAIRKAQSTKKLRVAIKTVIAVNRFARNFGSSSSIPTLPEGEIPEEEVAAKLIQLKGTMLKRKKGGQKVTSFFTGGDSFKETTIVLSVPEKTISYYEGDVFKKLITIKRCTSREVAATEASGKANAFGVYDSRGLEMVMFIAATTIEKDQWIQAINSLEEA